MGKRKLAQIAESEEEEEEQIADAATPTPTPTPTATATADDEEKASAKEKAVNEEEEEQQEVEDGGDSDDEPAVEAKPLGEIIKRTGRGRLEKCHYQAFELEGNRYDLEDPVLVTPEERNQKPYVAIIKEIKQSKDGKIVITGQWFYRPEEADKKGGGCWTSSDSRELFYSFHRDEVAAESVMHKCVAHFIPPNKQPPIRSKHPGFIVRKVYDTVEKKLFKLTDKDYEDSKQAELDTLVQKTRASLGELLDIEPEEAAAEPEETEKGRRLIRRRAVQPINVNREEHIPSEMSARDGYGRPDTPAGTLGLEQQGGAVSEGFIALHECNAFTGNKGRDRWLEKLLQGVRHACTVDKRAENVRKSSKDDGINEKSPSAGERKPQEEALEACMPPPDSKMEDAPQVDGDIVWPQAAVAAVTGLERIAFETFNGDMHKYNLKMRQLDFNLKNGPVLARRLLKKELESLKVLNMSPAELKDGLTAEEKSAQEPEEPETMQMADVRCTICGEKKVGVKDIIHVGYGDRYQLECLKCGHSWYAPRDSISSLRIETINRRLPVGTAPWATSKFEEVEREFTSPRESGKPGAQEATIQSSSVDTIMTAKQLQPSLSPQRDGGHLEAPNTADVARVDNAL